MTRGARAIGGCGSVRQAACLYGAHQAARWQLAAARRHSALNIPGRAGASRYALAARQQRSA